MGKGKKFDAAEKYFYKKEVKLRQEMRKIIDWSDEIVNVNNQLVKENKQLKMEFNDLKEKYDKLLELSKLSEQEVKNLINASNTIVNLGAISKHLRSLM